MDPKHVRKDNRSTPCTPAKSHAIFIVTSRHFYYVIIQYNSIFAPILFRLNHKRAFAWNQLAGDSRSTRMFGSYWLFETMFLVTTPPTIKLNAASS